MAHHRAQRFSSGCLPAGRCRQLKGRGGSSSSGGAGPACAAWAADRAWRLWWRSAARRAARFWVRVPVRSGIVAARFPQHSVPCRLDVGQVAGGRTLRGEQQRAARGGSPHVLTIVCEKRLYVVPVFAIPRHPFGVKIWVAEI